MGWYVKYYHMHPDLDNGGVYDWTGYNTLSISYFIETASSTPGQTHFRLNISDYANIQDPSYTGLGEYYYSFQYILDNEPGWNTLDIPLMRTDDWSGYGFNLTGWAGEEENGVLDLMLLEASILNFPLEELGKVIIVVGPLFLMILSLNWLMMMSHHLIHPRILRLLMEII